MQEKTEEQILQEVRSINSKLGELVILLKMGQSSGIEERKSKILSKSPLRQQIYSLCDGKNTVSDIAKRSVKSMSLVSQTLTKLQEAGLISEERKGKQRIYRRVV
jgi:DNA-binding transcriptional ArsR family regulator